MCGEKFLRESQTYYNFKIVLRIILIHHYKSPSISPPLSLSPFFLSFLVRSFSRIDEIYNTLVESRGETRKVKITRPELVIDGIFRRREGICPRCRYHELITPMIRAIGGARARALEESRDFRGQVNGNIIIATGRYSL